jgi:hypothetical protein
MRALKKEDKLTWECKLSNIFKEHRWCVKRGKGDIEFAIVKIS